MIILKVENFISAAEDRDKTIFTDDELLNMIDCLRVMTIYFHTRKEYLISDSLRREMMEYEKTMDFRRMKK